jgi:hypothetical protein
MPYLLYPLGVAAFVFGTYGLYVLIGRFRKKRHQDEATRTYSPKVEHEGLSYAEEWLEERRKMHGPHSIHDDFYK